jgi:hypothetical protein
MFASITGWLKTQRVGLGILVVTAAALIGASMLAGCDMTKMIRVDVPREVQKALDLPHSISLHDSQLALEDYVRGGERFSQNIDEGNVRLGWLMSTADLGLRVGMAQLPAGGILVTLLGTLGGIFIKGPGTAKEKEASYNKGRADAEALLVPLLEAAGVEVPTPKEAV